MTGPNPFTTLDPASEAYEPQPASEHVESTKELLRWMRNYGVRADSIEVGKNGVRLIGVTDDYPRKREATQRPGPPSSPAEAGDDLFTD